jgi:hypothetical protein
MSVLVTLFCAERQSAAVIPEIGICRGYPRAGGTAGTG